MKNIIALGMSCLLLFVNISLATKKPELPKETESKITYIAPNEELQEYALEQYELENNTNHWVIKQKAYDIPLSASLQDYTIEVCEQYGIDVSLALAVMQVESHYTEDMIGDSGNSLGMMQIQPRWHKERMKRLGVDNLLDAQQNILTGVDILNELITKYNDVEYALICYNAGEGKAKKYKAKGISETKYSREVLEAQKQIELKLNDDSQTTECNKWSGVQATLQ